MSEHRVTISPAAGVTYAEWRCLCGAAGQVTKGRMDAVQLRNRLCARGEEHLDDVGADREAFDTLASL